MAARTLCFAFKLVYTNIVHYRDVEARITTSEFLRTINEDNALRELFNINEYYHIDIVVCGNYSQGQPELAQAILPSLTEIVEDKFHPDNTSFYLRPVHPITENFTRMNNYSVLPNETNSNTFNAEITITALNNESSNVDFNQIL